MSLDIFRWHSKMIEQSTISECLHPICCNNGAVIINASCTYLEFYFFCVHYLIEVTIDDACTQLVQWEEHRILTMFIVRLLCLCDNLDELSRIVQRVQLFMRRMIMKCEELCIQSKEKKTLLKATNVAISDNNNKIKANLLAKRICNNFMWH